MTREEAKEILTHNWTRVDNPNYSESELDEAFFTAIEALSINIVKCKDCEYADFKSPYPVCNLIEMNIADNDFCSWGERREL